MPKRFRQILISTVTFLGGLYFFLEYITPKELYDDRLGVIHEKILLGVQVTGVMAIGLGIINILRFHCPNIIRARKGWLNSLALLIGLVLSLSIQGFDFRAAERKNQALDSLAVLPTYIQHIETTFQDKAVQGEKAQLAIASLESYRDNADPLHVLNRSAANPEEQTLIDEYLTNLDAALVSANVWKLALQTGAADYTAKKEALLKSLSVLGQSARTLGTKRYNASAIRKSALLLNNGLFAALGSAMFALLAFYIATAAYRAFRIVSLEAALMMIVAIVVTLGQIPHGPMYISEDLPAIRLWLLKNLSTPAFRAIFFGATIAGLAMAVRMWLSLEKSPLAVEEDKRANE